MTTNANEIRQFCVACSCEWEPDALRQAYEAIVAAWVEANVPPDRLGGRAPGVGKGWKTFKPRDRLIRKTNFKGVEYFTLSHLAEPDESHPPSRLYPSMDWLAYTTVHNWERDRSIVLGWIPAIIGGPSRAFFDLFREIVTRGRAQYGYCYQQRYNMRPFWEEPPETPTLTDARMNGSWWEPDNKEQSGSLLLAGVYSQNYLGPEYLEAPLGKTAMTLREWIEDDPEQRGALKPFTDTLTEWSPPAQNIPKIREALYRAGRVFYWRFFCPTYREEGIEKPEPLYRPDLSAPWEAPDPIPEIYRADYWKDKDPSLTY